MPFPFAFFHPKQHVIQLSLVIKFKGSKLGKVALALRKPTGTPHRALQFWGCASSPCFKVQMILWTDYYTGVVFMLSP